MSPRPYLLLALEDNPQTATEPAAPQSRFVRALNGAARWAVLDHSQAPFLAWHSDDMAAAQAAAQHASEAHGRAVRVISHSDDNWQEGPDFQLFSEAHAPVLLGPARQSEARTRRLRTEADKLAAFCFVVRAASVAPDHAAFTEVSRAASKALQAKFGGGSITSAFAWVAGRAGRDALESVLTGETDLKGPLSIQEVADAVDLAQKAQLLQSEPEDPVHHH